jgi:hypothetical protein
LALTASARPAQPAATGGECFAAGGLISYGPDFVDLYWQAAGYVEARDIKCGDFSRTLSSPATGC